ncbi:MAG: M3 family oligoendopeptidase [Candidatus Brocadiia bacterium]
MKKKANGVVWDLTSFFPTFNGPEMAKFKKKLAVDIGQLEKAASALKPLDPHTAPAWEAVVLSMESIYARIGHISSYVGCLSSADARNEAYSAEEAALVSMFSRMEKIDVDLMTAMKTAPETVFERFLARKAVQPVAHFVRRIRERGKHTMDSDMEKLCSDLGVDGFHAWGRLYDKVTGKLEFDMVWPDGTKKRLPISQWRSLMADADRSIGRAAYECGNRAWESIEDTCAATLNSISGTRLTLYKRRGIDSFLQPALFQSSIRKETLDAMYKAIYADAEIARDIFRAKARIMGRRGIAWFEREAPLPLKDTSRFDWQTGSQMVQTAFGEVYPALADYYAKFLKHRWMESEPRAGKRPGAFCTGSAYTGEQRVYMTYNGALGDINTIAHEIGHAWHSHLLKEMRPLAQEYPMTLAETASIFAEQIFAEGVYKDPCVSDDAKLQMLDNDLGGAAIMLLDITIRFEFEKALYTERAKGEVSVSRMKELMVETQRRVFGNAMVKGGEDPMFWASKLHFYITGVNFYNFPYTFGFLLSKALFNLFRKEGPAFLPRYEDFLRLTGSAPVEEVAMRSIGADLTKPKFWSESINSLNEPLALYKKLLSKKAAKGN